VNVGREFSWFIQGNKLIKMHGVFQYILVILGLGVN